MKRNCRISGVLSSGLIGALAVLVLATSAPARAEDSVRAQGLVDRSRVTFDAFVADKEMTWLNAHLEDARGILIMPQILKGAFIFGASGGSGVLVVRDEKTGEWSEPAFYNIGSVSFGLQIGASAAEVVTLVMSQRGVDALLATSVKLGGDVSAAIGPVGAGAAAKGIRADLISFARAKGIYIGVSLEGAVVDTADSMNRAYYDKSVSPADILIRNEVKNPGSEELRASLKKSAK
jgi:lipid-binding SYLF domain-containing protein